MAKAGTGNEEKKAKKSTRKKTSESAAAAEAHADSSTKDRSNDATESKATAEATSGASKKAKASTSSASSKESDAKSAAKSQAAPTEQAAATATAEATSQGGAGTLDPALLPARSGKIGIFGGPKDRGIKPDDKLALPTGRHFTFERVRSLNPKSFYCAMRWDYHVLGKSIGEGQRWWANKKLIVTNPASGAAVIVRAVDFGPPESTGLAIAVSPGAADALGVNVGDEVEIAFADPRLPTGAVE